MTETRPLRYLAALVLLAGLSAGIALNPAQPETALASSGARLALPNLDGVWSGNWFDTTFTVPGATDWTIITVGSTLTVNGTMDLSGVGPFGTAEPFTLLGTITGNTLNYTWSFDPSSGATITGSGALVDTGIDNMTGTGNATLPAFGTFDYTCTITDNSIMGTFGGFGSGGAGTISMTKTTTVDTETWAGIKAAYRDGAE